MINNDSYWHNPQFINDLINQLPAAIFWKDTSSVFLGCNQYFAKLANLTPSEIIGKTDYEMPWGKKEASLYIKDDQEIIKTQKPKLNIEESQTLSDGQVIILLTNKIPLFHKNTAVGILGIYHDITERKRIEQALFDEKEKTNLATIAQTKAEAAKNIAEARAEKEEEMRKTVMVLVGDIVHDLRTPIATIRTISSLLNDILPNLLIAYDEHVASGNDKSHAISKRQLNCLRNNFFVNSLESSAQMINDFINTSLIELDNAQKEDQDELSLVKCSSRRVLERTLESFQLDKSIKLTEQISYDFDLMGNSIIIMKILFNLLRNAEEQIKINGKGEIYITTEESSDANHIKVKDTAGGVPPEVIQKMFSPFFTTKEGGTGIGLAYCQSTMKKFGGELTCQSIYGEYIEFVLSFPKIKK